MSISAAGGRVAVLDRDHEVGRPGIDLRSLASFGKPRHGAVDEPFQFRNVELPIPVPVSLAAQRAGEGIGQGTPAPAVDGNLLGDLVPVLRIHPDDMAKRVVLHFAEHSHTVRHRIVDTPKPYAGRSDIDRRPRVRTPGHPPRVAAVRDKHDRGLRFDGKHVADFIVDNPLMAGRPGLIESRQQKQVVLLFMTFQDRVLTSPMAGIVEDQRVALACRGAQFAPVPEDRLTGRLAIDQHPDIPCRYAFERIRHVDCVVDSPLQRVDKGIVIDADYEGIHVAGA